MRSIFSHLYIIFFFFICFNTSNAQPVLNKINKIEKSVFTINAIDINGDIISTASGFFINANGMAIAPTFIFSKSDSIRVVLRNGRKFGISKILSTHKMANLALFQVRDTRQKGFEYIIPSQQIETNKNEVLIFSHPSESEAGVTLGVTSQVYQCPFLDRVVKLDANFGEKSIGAPVINENGNLIGIAGYLKETGEKHFLTTHLIDDSLWVSHPFNDWKKSLFFNYKENLNPFFLEGLLSFTYGHWVNAAKHFTLYLKTVPDNIEATIFRGESRRRYENHMGMRSDFTTVKLKKPKHFLYHYFLAKAFIDNDKDKEAFLSLIASIEDNDHFALALVDFGLLAVKLREDIETALKCYNEAIIASPLYAKGFYERSRLLQQYFHNDSLAMEDITKTIQLNHFLPGAYSIRGTLRIQTENYLEAIADFDKAIELNENDTHALFNRGVAYYNLGMKEQCCKDWDTAGQLGHYKSIKFMSRYCSKIPRSRTSSR